SVIGLSFILRLMSRKATLRFRRSPAQACCSRTRKRPNCSMAAHDEPPVWMEIWQPRGGYVMVPATDRDGFLGEKGPALAATWRDERRAQLAAAAPACVRALLAVEW